MKKLVGVVLCVLLVAGCLAVVIDDEKVGRQSQKIIETEPIKYLTDAELSLLYTCRDDVRNPSTTVVELTQADAWLLMKLAVSETGDRGMLAQYFVMMTVLNRLKDDRFPDDISEIIYAENQFAVTTNGVMDKAEPNLESHLALAMVEQGIDKSEGAVYFEASTNSTESWHYKNKTFLYEIDGQRYYK